ncbi:MAG: DUF1566 domain-containing protein [Mariprofundaceae bacterium]|nr:DUF1566 domain-containing protein [Mariprofundaceae bacterium]
MNESEYLHQGMLHRGRVRHFIVFNLLILTLLWGNQAIARWIPQICQTTTITASTPTADFVDNGDGTVTHSKTGLMWKRCSEGQIWNGATCTGAATPYSWQGGLQQAEALNNAGGFATFTNWRLPNIKELNSIVEVQCIYPAINATIFPSSSGLYWSASPYSADATKAWFVQIYNVGFIELSIKTRLGHLFFVRDR